MTQSTLTKPSEKTTFGPSGIDTSSLESITFADDLSFDESGKSMQPEPRYHLSIDKNVVEKISSLAAQKIDGIVDMKGNVLSAIQEGLGGNDRKKGVDADVTDERSAKVELSVILEYGKSANDVFDQLKDIVTQDIREMTGLDVAEVTVNVVDVMDEEEIEQRSNNNGGALGAISNMANGNAANNPSQTNRNA